MRPDADRIADERGTGLLGLADRVAAFEGQLEVVSPPGAGTLITATLPLPHPQRESSFAST